jgi:hypothetical protein
MTRANSPRGHATTARNATARHATTIRLALALGLAGGLAACAPAAAGPSGTSGTPSTSSGSPTSSVFGPTSIPTSAYHPSPSPPATLPSQTRTSWGVIWDALPRGFPAPPAAEPTDTGDPEPASAALAVPTTAAATKEWYRSALPAAGYTVADVNGPYENGGFVIDAVGAPAGCRVQLSLARTGTTTTVTILFGAACPFRA